MFMQQQTYKADFQTECNLIFNVGCNVDYQQILKRQLTQRLCNSVLCNIQYYICRLMSNDQHATPISKFILYTHYTNVILTCLIRFLDKAANKISRRRRNNARGMDALKIVL